MADLLKNPIFNDETAARKWLEARVWPKGPVCPHCGGTGDDVTELEAGSHRAGLFQCNQCREQFTVTVKTVFERSKIPLTKWLAALFLMTASKKGVSAHQVHRMLGISYKSTWFMMHRLREAMRQGGLEPLGGTGKVVEADETYFGNIPEAQRPKFTKSGRPVSKNPGGPKNKRAIVALVERGGRVRAFHPAVADGATVAKIVRDNIVRETRLHTDESKLYHGVGKEFASHETVAHSLGEYVRGDVNTNTIEGYFSIFKRGMRGVYQHCSEKHLHRYLAEFDFRYNNRAALGVDDTMRAETLAAGIVGKRLTYRRPHQA
ncbi:MAG TPA: IS1595 family transposase [Pseudolabrys sp.]|nr:IS1595 family transposase [Pseudolabrys sp.]